MTSTFDSYSSDGKEQVPEPFLEWMVFNHCGSMHFYYYRWEDKSNFNNILHIFLKKFMYVRSVIHLAQPYDHIHSIERLAYMTCYLTTDIYH